MNICNQCGNKFEAKTKRALFCSDKCRASYNREKVNTDRVEIDEPKENVFYFRTKDKTTKTKLSEDIRSATVWYNVPLSAVPIIKKGYPEMPDFMDGRQYFLWWKNDFKVNEKNNMPVIYNPYPKYDKLEYYQAGDNSRRWGA